MSILNRIKNEQSILHKINKEIRSSQFSRTGEFIPVELDFITSADREKVIADADLLVQGYYQVFNYPHYILKDWNTDCVTGFKISKALSPSLIRVSKLYDKVDVKNYWDQSHLYGAVTLSEAYAFTKDSKYSSYAVWLMLDWIQKNPIGKTVGWKCPMDVAIRLANIVMTCSLLCDSKDFMKEESKLAGAIYAHVLYVDANYENTGKFPNNHYLSDLVGVIWGCAFLERMYGSQKGYQILQNALLRIEKELDRQIYPCGFDYENSVYYHCFVTELISETVSMLKSNGFSVSEKMDLASQKMLGVCHWFNAFRPGGIPIIGDQDGSRLFLFTGFFDVDRCDFSSLSRFHMVESDASDGGIYKLENKDFLVYLKAGHIGTGGRGTHDHNDHLSVSVYYENVPIVVDGGTYAYTFDLEKRKLYRSEKKHSVMELLDEVQNDVFSDVFSVEGSNTSQLIALNPLRAKFTYPSGRQYGREVYFEKDNLVIRDAIQKGCYGISRLILPFTMRDITQIDKYHLSISTHVGELVVTSDSEITVTEDKRSPAYGIEKECCVVSVNVCGSAAYRIGVANNV